MIIVHPNKRFWFGMLQNGFSKFFINASVSLPFFCAILCILCKIMEQWPNNTVTGSIVIILNVLAGQQHWDAVVGNRYLHQFIFSFITRDLFFFQAHPTNPMTFLIGMD